MNIEFPALSGLLIATLAAEVLLLALLLRSGWALRLAADVPNDRSLHTRVTPRVGGLVAIPLALLPASLAFPGMRSVAAAGLVLWMLSFVDDRRGLPVILRLAAQAAAGVMLLVAAMPFPPVVALAVLLLLIWGANLYNFMDGADGLAGGMALSGFLAYGIVAWGTAPEISGLAMLLAVSAFGFLLFNFPPARVFLGDAGSVPFGFLAASLGALGWQRQLWPAWFPLLVFSPFVVDASMTLLKRLLWRERVWQAHRDHYYQRLVRMGWSHRRLAWMAYLMMAASASSAILLLGQPEAVRHAGLAAWLAIFVFIMTTIDLCWKKHLRNSD